MELIRQPRSSLGKHLSANAYCNSRVIPLHHFIYHHEQVLDLLAIAIEDKGTLQSKLKLLVMNLLGISMKSRMVM